MGNMNRKNNGQGFGQNDDFQATSISNSIFISLANESLVPNIALADAEFEGDLTKGDKVKFFVEFEEDNRELWQKVQENEATEPDVINLKTVEMELCNTRSIDIKLSVNQLRDLKNHGKDSIYFNVVNHRMKTSLEELWDESHLAHLLMMTSKDNTGNHALGQYDLGSPDNPIIIPADTDKQADTIFKLLNNMESVLAERNAAKLDGSNFLILPNRVYSSGRSLFIDHNICCDLEKSIIVTGRMPKTLLGFDAFRTNRRVLRTKHNGRDIYYVILGDKKANGFVSDIYNVKWHEEKRDWFLVGTEVHGSYVTNPNHFAVAVVAFE